MKNEERLSLPVNIYRYKFSQEFMLELYNFSKIHQYDDRESFKEAWKLWTQDNEEIIDQEIITLKAHDYEGNVLDKMFKSARYYFRKKGTEKKEPTKRREYINMGDDLLKSMDNHIIQKIMDPKYKPQTGFTNFCEENMEVLKSSVQTICAKGITDPVIIQDKMKKTYKNRYFMLVHTHQNTNK